jgi:hypothetical protein
MDKCKLQDSLCSQRQSTRRIEAVPRYFERNLASYGVVYQGPQSPAIADLNVNDGSASSKARPLIRREASSYRRVLIMRSVNKCAYGTLSPVNRSCFLHAPAAAAPARN